MRAKEFVSEGFWDFLTGKSNNASTTASSITVPKSTIGPDVADLQKALLAIKACTSQDLGNLGPKKDGVDGIRGPLTTGAVRKFQQSANIQGDGTPDQKTIDAINSVLKSTGATFRKSTENDVSPAGRGGNTKVDLSTIQDPDFKTKVDKVAKALGVDSSALMKIIQFETAGTFSPTSHDPWNVSIGLIGFTKNTAIALGTTKEQLAQMTAVEQLDYVYKFYVMNHLKPGSDVGTMYMLTFMPAYAYAPDDTVLGEKGGGELGHTGLSMDKIWNQNPGFGKSRHKNYFTVGDVKNLIMNR